MMGVQISVATMGISVQDPLKGENRSVTSYHIWTYMQALCILVWKYLLIHVHCCFIHNIQSEKQFRFPPAGE